MKRLLLSLSVTLAALAATPAGVQGRWVSATTSATNYWDDNGVFLGNGSGSGQLYEFDGRGNYKYYMVMEVRTYGMVSKVRTNCSGTVAFNGDTFSVKPSKGHYHSEMGSKVTDRPMNGEDLSRQAGTYHWRLENRPDGKTHFVVPFDDGSSHDFVPAP